MLRDVLEAMSDARTCALGTSANRSPSIAHRAAFLYYYNTVKTAMHRLHFYVGWSQSSTFVTIQGNMAPIPQIK
jgi:hypothetical protein